jgi:CrcB protein
MKTFTLYLAVAGAGALGAVSRLLVGTACGRWFGTGLPVGTFVINITGSLVLGWFLAAAESRGTISETTRLAVAVGFVGSYTTFSTFMHESNSLIESGSQVKATINLIGSLIVGLVAVRAGIWMARG